MRADAGVDYDIERLTWLWRNQRSRQGIIELNQRGINRHEPGPYSEMEQDTRRS